MLQDFLEEADFEELEEFEQELEEFVLLAVDFDDLLHPQVMIFLLKVLMFCFLVFGCSHRIKKLNHGKEENKGHRLFIRIAS